MNSLGKSSKWPSCESLPSTPGLLISESEQTEDEADVFSSEGEGDSGVNKSHGTISTIRLAFPSHPDRPLCRSEDVRDDHCPDKMTHQNSSVSPGAITFSSSSATPGDQAFAQKCADLQRFIRPLFELLNGLKTGRFDKGLSSFQQSVAMDRLQRILGILQKPDMGEKYFRTLLQVEMMLKIWFPLMAKERSTAAPTATPRLHQRWRQNQLHIPVKKRKLSWIESDAPDIISPQCKRHQQDRQMESCQTDTSKHTEATGLPVASNEHNSLGQNSWTSACDGAGTLDGPLYSCSRRETVSWKQLANPSPSPSGSPATQDSSVSSSSTVPLVASP